MAQLRQVRVRDTLVKASQRIATVLDLQEVVHTVLEAALKVIPHVEQVIFYYRPDLKSELSRIGLTGDGTFTVESTPLEESLVTKALHDKKTVYHSDWMADSDQTPRSLIIEPLVLTGMSLGALAVIGRQPDVFDSDHGQILTMLANQAAIALQNAWLYAEARRVDEIEALHEAGNAINRTLDLQETLTTTMAVSRSLTGASISNVYLYTSEYHRIDSVVTLNEDLPLADADRRRAAEIAWDVLEGHRPSLIVEPQDIPGVPEANKEVDADPPIIQAWLAVPLPTGDSSMGVLELGSERADAFTSNDVRLMQIISSHAAAAIEKARLYEEVQQRLQQTEALNAISQSISTTLELQRVLELVVNSAAKTIPVATHSMLYLLDPSSKNFELEAKFATKGKTPPSEFKSAREKTIQKITEQSATVRTTHQNEEYGSWSMLVAPLKAGEKVIGAISVESPRLDAFLSGDETLLNTFASYASIAIQNANLFRDLSSAYLDLTQKQEEILRSHSTLQALFNGITDGLYIVGHDMQIIAINRAEAERLGRTSSSLVGQLCDASLWGKATAAMTKLVQDTFETGKEGNWESRIAVAHRGPFTDRDVHTYPIFEVSGKVRQVIIFAQDVSERRRLQASLYRSANLAAVGQLASSVAHQINNPLTVIIANSQIMGMDAQPDSPDYSLIKHIEEAGAHIRNIVQNLLDFSTQDIYDWFETDIQETIEDALTLVTHSLRKSDISVVKRVEELPIIIASASHLKLLWMNLLLNARDAISAGGGDGKIEVLATKPDPKNVQIQIIDNGIGIPFEHRDRLFHPFFTTKPTGKHLGLGLFTCRAIVESHQGQIEIDTYACQEDSGTIVTVTLPIPVDLGPDCQTNS
jgi:two-component system NtrC family sensor kinase